MKDPYEECMWFKSEKCNPSSMKQFHSLNLTTLPNNFNEKLLWFRSRLQRCSIKKVFLEISQNSQENTCARVSILVSILPDSIELFHGGDPYHKETSPLVCFANQWTGFYMIRISVMKELKQEMKLKNFSSHF